MARRAGRPRPRATTERRLETNRERCWSCGGPLWVAYHNRRRVTFLDEVVQFTLVIRRCRMRSCARYQRAYRPEEEGARALPHGEIGFDVIALVGQLRYREHRSVPEIHQELGRRGVVLGERTVGHLIERYEELVALRQTDHHRLRGRLAREGGVVLALDGTQPDVGHEVLWVIRDCLTGEPLLARSLLSATEADLAVLLREVKDALPDPILGVVSDGQHSIRRAVTSALPGAPHQLCRLHHLREAARPIERVSWPTVPNVLVETADGVPITSGSLAPPQGSTTAVFYIRKTSGDSATLPLTVTGAFGSWQTFVGGGPNAW